MNQLRPAIVMIVLMTILTGLLYPLAMTGIAQIAFPHQANGSLIERNGTVIGSELIGQSFTGRAISTAGPRRPATATTPPPPPAPTSARPARRWPSASRRSVDELRAEGVAGPIPADLVTTSGSGLDPHISPAAAELQVPRVAAARDVPEDKVRAARGAVRPSSATLRHSRRAARQCAASELALDATAA